MIPVRNKLRRLAGAVARKLTAHRPRILMYHRFGPDGGSRHLGSRAFEMQLQHLVSRFRPAHLHDVVKRIRSGEPLDSRTVVLTVDDGYQDFADYAYPLLQKYEVPATVYVTSRFATGSFWLWFDALRWLSDTGRPGTYDFQIGAESRTFQLSSSDSRHELWLWLADACLSASPTRQKEVIQDVCGTLDLPIPINPTEKFSAMTWDTLRGLDPNLVEIGAHSRTHPILSHCTLEVQRDEVAGSKLDIEAAIQRAARTFCYPNGQASDLSVDTEQLVRASGYESAVVAYGGLASKESNLYRLERLPATQSDTLFLNAMDGLWHMRRLVQDVSP